MIYGSQRTPTRPNGQPSGSSRTSSSTMSPESSWRIMLYLREPPEREGAKMGPTNVLGTLDPTWRSAPTSCRRRPHPGLSSATVAKCQLDRALQSQSTRSLAGVVSAFASRRSSDSAASISKARLPLTGFARPPSSSPSGPSLLRLSEHCPSAAISPMPHVPYTSVPFRLPIITLFILSLFAAPPSSVPGVGAQTVCF